MQNYICCITLLLCLLTVVARFLSQGCGEPEDQVVTSTDPSPENPDHSSILLGSLAPVPDFWQVPVNERLDDQKENENERKCETTSLVEMASLVSSIIMTVSVFCFVIMIKNIEVREI